MKYIIPSFSERFPIYESVEAARSFLLKRYAVDKNIKTSEIDEETKKRIINDPKFLEIKDLTANATGYTPLFTKFRFDQGATMEDLRNILGKLEKYRQKTPEEKLELRSLDSGPYNQKLTDYFSDKLPEMEKQGKEYVLTTDDVQSFSPNEIKKTFASELPSMNTRNYNN